MTAVQERLQRAVEVREADAAERAGFVRRVECCEDCKLDDGLRHAPVLWAFACGIAVGAGALVLVQWLMAVGRFCWWLGW